ncbi:hypothetical protein Goari_003341 [Gossypium aridum]|uniref:Uncharacterized protein n=1 Tax=Gossypium aridum TaxID=34290 RepID=A0A7J8YB58_GOSAI|nr:hypothetical protein [Gossypium aridum]
MSSATLPTVEFTTGINSSGSNSGVRSNASKAL